MRVFKFGGASVKDAQAIRNLGKILEALKGGPLVVVVSAMGKTTNALEGILKMAFNQEDYEAALEGLIQYHLSVIHALFPETEDTAAEINRLFSGIREELDTDLLPKHYGLIYDRVISLGEMAATKIVSAHLNAEGIKAQWKDARQLIKTDSTFREAKVDWVHTCKNIDLELPEILKEQIVVTQGFIGADQYDNPTTLGREGSDYSAAIFAGCLNAKEVVIWKDVPGILNADPKRIKSVEKYAELPYQEAAEMTFYGATVIHPKTIKPLANQKIPLWVRPFDDIGASGTCIHDCQVKHLTPAIIFKPNQCLISFRVKDFTFINERNLSQIFQVVDELNIKVNLMQNSAISFSICVDNHKSKISILVDKLREDFEIYYNDQLQLITIKNYTSPIAEEVSNNREILLEQRTRSNYQIVVKEEN